MNLHISRTADGLKSYPLHQHRHYELIIYPEGTGELCTKNERFPFVPATFMIIPPGTEHGSRSENGFRNICVEGDFDQFFDFREIVVCADNGRREGTRLAGLIYENRDAAGGYLNALCIAYIHFLLMQLQLENPAGRSVKQFIAEISRSAFDPNLNVPRILNGSRYSEDYIRAVFRKVTGKTPIEFLTDIRIRQACSLIDIYKDTWSLAQIAEKCGYPDYAYFCRKFRELTGMSPRAYRDA